MSLSDEYGRQFALRSWAQIFELLPSLAQCVVLDLGCGIGDQAAELVARGASVIGFDANEALLESARARKLTNAEFRSGDIGEPLEIEGFVDGIWCSFAAAYFPDLVPRLKAWKEHLKPGGWIALTEVDDLFGHEPAHAETKSLLDSYARDALAKNRYDFHMGRKLSSHLSSAGFTVQKSVLAHDKELSFDGPAEPAVLAAWKARLNRLGSLQRFCGPKFQPLQDDFLAALANSEHRSTATVLCCVAIT